jgi:hypothetical protein
MITIVPGGGLANRMRAIDSAYNLAIQHKQKLKIVWIKNRDLNCSFDLLFKESDCFDVKEFSLLDFYAYPNYLQLKHPFIKKIVLKQRHHKFDTIILNKQIHDSLYIQHKPLDIVNNYKHLFIDTCERFIQASSLAQLFKPTEAIIKQVELSTKAFHSNTIGLHIRRTDNTAAINASPLSFFEAQIIAELKENKSTTFFLCTDDAEVKLKIKQKFGPAIITREVNFSRNKRTGMLDAWIDFICLSRCSKIIGSAHSSFSVEASTFGNIILKTPIDLQ